MVKNGVTLPDPFFAGLDGEHHFALEDFPRVCVEQGGGSGVIAGIDSENPAHWGVSSFLTGGFTSPAEYALRKPPRTPLT